MIHISDWVPPSFQNQHHSSATPARTHTLAFCPVQQKEPVLVYLQAVKHWWIKEDMGREREEFHPLLSAWLVGDIETRHWKLKFIFPLSTILITILSKMRSMPRQYSSDICGCQWGVIYVCCAVDMLRTLVLLPEFLRRKWRPIREINLKCRLFCKDATWDQ